MSFEPVLYETHMHTPLCKHAIGQPEEYAAVAEKRGLKGIIVTCHNPTEIPWSAHLRMSMADFDKYATMVDRARRAWADRLDIRLGMESDYAPGMEAWVEKLHQMAEFHYILGSVHPDIREYKQQYFKGDAVEFQRLYFQHLAMAAESGLYDALSHPDLVKNSDPAQWNLERVMDTIQQSLDRIAATGVAMELNTSGLNKAIKEMNPSRTMLQEMRQRNIPVVVGADAHDPKRVAANYEEALDLLKEVGYTHVSLFLNRERQDIEIDQARASLKLYKG
jgi:histidinol-phosphatase (PHP family)